MGVRVAFIGDLHLGRSTKGIDRTPDVVEAFHLALLEATDAGAESLVILGDVFDSSNPPPELEALAADLLIEAARAFSTVVVLVGNHDLRHGTDREDALATLRRSLRSDDFDVHFPTKPTAIQVFDEGGSEDAWILALPYESRSRRAWTSPSEYDAEIAAEVEDLRSFAVAGHLDLEGALLSSEAVARGGGHPWPPGAGWRDRVSVAVDGHFHRPQTATFGGWTVEVCGSLVPLDFGEANERKRILVADVP